MSHSINFPGFMVVMHMRGFSTTLIKRFFTPHTMGRVSYQKQQAVGQNIRGFVASCYSSFVRLPYYFLSPQYRRTVSASTPIRLVFTNAGTFAFFAYISLLAVMTNTTSYANFTYVALCIVNTSFIHNFIKPLLSGTNLCAVPRPESENWSGSSQFFRDT